MDYINIISQEEIKVLPNWFDFTLLGILVAIIFIPIVVAWRICKKKEKPFINVFYTELIAGVIAIACTIVSSFLIEPRMLVPSGRFRYEATIDKDHITVSEYEDFIEKYKPEIRDGIYYFETNDVLEVDTYV